MTDEIGRIINIILNLLILALLVRKYKLHWHRYQTRTKDFWWVMFLWSVVVVYGTFEQLMGWHTNIRIVLTMLASLVAIKLLLKPNEADQPTFTNLSSSRSKRGYRVAFGELGFAREGAVRTRGETEEGAFGT